MRERIRRIDRFPEQDHHALIAAAESNDDEAKAARRDFERLRELGDLGGKVCGEIFHAVIAEVAVKLAVERKLLVVEGLDGRARALDVIGGKGIAAHLGDGLLHDAVEVRGEDDAAGT